MTISRRSFFQQAAIGALSGTAISFQSDELLANRQSHILEADQVVAPIRLDNNENAYGPSKKAIQAMTDCLPFANRYPDSGYTELLEAIAALHRTEPENVILGCGSTEVLRMIAAAFLGPKRKLILASPTFDLMTDEARRLKAEVISVPLTKVYAHNLNSMRARVDGETGLVYICNPNNPTGSLTLRQDLENFLRKLPARIPVVIDEAYFDYVGESLREASFLDRPVDDDRLVVLRTLSAIHGLAGLRVGYAVADVRLARQISANRLPFDINTIAARTALAALADPEHVRACQQRNMNAHQEFLNVANARMLRSLESHTNFVMLKTERNGQDVIAHFRKNNILLGRPVPSMPEYVRISLGTPEDMKEFWRVWDLMPAVPHKMEM